jgi:hypothetical protein
MNVADQPSPPPIDNVDEVEMLANATDTTLSSDPLPGNDHDALVSKGRDCHRNTLTFDSSIVEKDAGKV